MTIVVTVRVNDGIVLAADSATSFFDAEGLAKGVAKKVYNNANKIFNLVKGWPIGAMTYGAGSIGPASISTLSKDFRELLTPSIMLDILGAEENDYALDADDYTVLEVAEKAKRFFFDECYRQEYPEPQANYFLGYRLCGYSAGSLLPEAWEIRIKGDECEGPDRLYPDDAFGPRWTGETDALDRLILGVGAQTGAALEALLGTVEG